MSEQFPAWYEGKHEIEKSGVYATADHVDYEGVVDSLQNHSLN